MNTLAFTWWQVEDNFVLENEKEKFVEELRAIVGQAQEILHVHSAAEKSIGVDSVALESNSNQVRALFIKKAIWGLCQEYHHFPVHFYFRQDHLNKYW